MKKAAFSGIALALLAGLSITVIGCNVKNETGEKEPVSVSNPGPDTSIVYKDTVHLSTAQAGIQHYVDVCDQYMNDKVPIRSYTINKADLYGVLGVTDIPNAKFHHCRVYLGLDGNNKFKLYMTPTVRGPQTKGSIDSIYVDKIPYDSIHNTYFVYDLNAPCPSTCDKSSKLYIQGRD